MSILLGFEIFYRNPSFFDILFIFFFSTQIKHYFVSRNEYKCLTIVENGHAGLMPPLNLPFYMITHFYLNDSNLFTHSSHFHNPSFTLLPYDSLPVHYCDGLFLKSVIITFAVSSTARFVTLMTRQPIRSVTFLKCAISSSILSNCA